jgi:tetratricopeptide (TPR) repeat protein
MPPSRRAAQARLAEFLETAERLKNERAAAGAVLEMVEATPPEAWPSLAERPEFQTNAALEKLSDEVRRRLDRNPREALALSELATTIADALPATAYPAVTLAQIRAMAWKDRANALRFLGRIPETFEAIDRAEQALDKHIALGLDRAVVEMVKALALLNTGDIEQARTLAITCGSVFLSHGDLTRALNAGEIEAHVLYETKRYDDAYALFKSLIDVARAISDTEAEARCHHNAASCAMYLDDFKVANIHFSEAIAKLTDLGDVVNATRAQWGAGLLLLGKGQRDSAFKRLYAARTAFVNYDMYEEAGLCALAIAEAHLSSGDGDEARKLVHEIAREFRDSPVERRIIDAVAVLEDTIGDSAEPIEAVRSVYTLIESVQAERKQL